MGRGQQRYRVSKTLDEVVHVNVPRYDPSQQESVAIYSLQLWKAAGLEYKYARCPDSWRDSESSALGDEDKLSKIFTRKATRIKRQKSRCSASHSQRLSRVIQGSITCKEGIFEGQCNNSKSLEGMQHSSTDQQLEVAGSKSMSLLSGDSEDGHTAVLSDSGCRLKVKINLNKHKPQDEGKLDMAECGGSFENKSSGNTDSTTCMVCSPCSPIHPVIEEYSECQGRVNSANASDGRRSGNLVKQKLDMGMGESSDDTLHGL